MRGRRGYALSIGRVRRFEGKFDLRRLFSALLPCLECWQSLIFPAASVSLSSFAYLLFVSSLPAVCWESLSILKRKAVSALVLPLLFQAQSLLAGRPALIPLFLSFLPLCIPREDLLPVISRKR
jgi:hypothetical protein